MSQKLKEVKSKTGRRGNNEGSIYQRKDGRWVGSVTVGYKSDGKPIRKDVYGKNRQEVAKKVASKTTEVFANGYISVSAREERNFQILMQEWFDTFKAPNLESSTAANRQNMLDNHIFKAFGKLDIQNVTLERLQKFFNAKVKDGTAADSIGKMKGLINNFFIYAIKKGYIRENPVQDVSIRKRNDANNDKGKAKALRQEIRQQVFEWVAENPILKPIVITFSFTGLRPQELIALEWRHINLEQKTISVKQAIKRTVTSDVETGKVVRGVKIGNTKTPKSVRTIAIPDIVVEVIKEWKDYCTTNNIYSEFVFSTKTGDMRTYSGLRSMLVRFVKRHNLQDEGISLYTFRHTFATILLEERENPRIVADLMGHVKVSTTLDIYSHVVNNVVYEKTAQTLDGVFKRFV